MKVGELKSFLENVPDDFVVEIFDRVDGDWKLDLSDDFRVVAYPHQSE